VTAATTLRESPKLDERVHEAVLDDGLRTFILPKPGFLKSFAIIVTGYGSIDNEFVPLGASASRRYPEGIAHFLEHKLFEDEAGDVFDEFARLGASANAFTSHAVTAYHFSASERFYDCLDLLVDFVADPYFTEEAIEKERKVIAQEIRMYDDMPDQRGHLNLLRALYHRHPIREDIPGTVSSIKEITKAQLEECYRTFYRPDNMALVVAGDVEPREALARIEANAARRAAKFGVPPRGQVVRSPIVERPDVRSHRVEERLSVSRPHVWIGWKDPRPGQRGDAYVKKEFEVAFLLDLLFGRSTAFYEDNYASGLLDGSFGARYVTERDDHAYTVVFGETDDPEKLVRVVEGRVKETLHAGLSAEDFARIKNKAFGRFLRSFNSLDYVGTGYAEAYFQGWDFLRYLDVLEPLSLAEVERHLALFQESLRAVSIVWSK
jgi:predicted Zn-dependent peptidase